LPVVLRLLRWAAGTALVLVLVLLAAFAYGTWTVRRPLPDVDGTTTLSGLSGPVDVYRDAQGVPRLYADTAEDLFRAQGYVHAQDRFWEMDVRRHVTAGRLAELFGADQVETDAFTRTLGWRRLAEREMALLAPASRRYLRAYADGVNTYLRGRSGAELALEYAVLGVTNRDYAPEQWQPADSLAWLKAMAWDLNANMGSEADRVLLSESLQPEQVEQLYPRYPYARHRTIVSAAELAASGGGARAAPAAPVTAAAAMTGAAPALRAVRGVAGALDAVIGRTGVGVGSNAWAVSGRHTDSGRPLLANDPHLAPSLPSTWTQVGLHCRVVSRACPFDVAGFSFAGLPGVVIGHNDRVAWGFSNLGADVSDLVLERVRGDDYLTEDGFRPLETRSEILRVAGRDPVRITVRSTRHGPLISDASKRQREVAREAPVTGAPAPADRGAGYAVALRWTALRPGRTADAIFALALARDFASFRAAAAGFEVPAQNLVYADVDGSIGYQAPGRVPIRSAGDGRWPVPGWTGTFEWTGVVPYDELPNVLDPADGLVVTGNQAVVPPGYPYLLTGDWSYGYRSQRLRELLEAAVAAGRRLDAGDMLALQTDSRHPAFQALRPALLSVPGLSGYLGQGQRVLRTWDGQQGVDSAGAAYFNAVWDRLLELTFHDQIPDAELRPNGGDRWVEVVRRLLNRPVDAFWDDLRTAKRETRDTVLRSAMVLARDDVTRLSGREPADWRWGRMHTLELRHATLGMSGIGALEWLFNRGPYPVGGGSDAPQATAWNAREGFGVMWVPSMRMVVDLSELDASQWVNLTGQSGHAFSDHYVDQVDAWRTGRLYPMRWDPAAVRDGAEDTLVLEPARSS
jgi:penicillin amidase